MPGECWFTYVYESQIGEADTSCRKGRSAPEVRSAHRQQQHAARLRRHQVRLATSKPAELVEVANWASSPTEVIEWIGEDSNWPPTDDPIANLIAKQGPGQCSAWSAQVSDPLVERR